MNRSSARKQTAHPIVMPNLDLPDVEATLNLWLVPLGRSVVQGDRIVEIVAGDVLVVLSSPASGQFVECCVSEQTPVRAGDVLGIIRQR